MANLKYMVEKYTLPKRPPGDAFREFILAVRDLEVEESFFVEEGVRANYRQAMSIMRTILERKYSCLAENDGHRVVRTA